MPILICALIVFLIRKISAYEKSLEENLFILHKVRIRCTNIGLYDVIITYRILVLLYVR